MTKIRTYGYQCPFDGKNLQADLVIGLKTLIGRRVTRSANASMGTIIDTEMSDHGCVIIHVTWDTGHKGNTYGPASLIIIPD